MENAFSKWPEKFVERTRLQFHESHENFLLALENEPAVSIRINPRKFSKKLSCLEPVKWCSTGVYLKERPSFTLDPLLHAGAYYVQESSSMFLEQAFKQIPNNDPLLVLDLCGSPGGKSTHLLSLLSEKDLLVTNEVIRSRAYILLENVQKWGHQNVVVTNNDPKDFSELKGMFDLIVVDAPCSGEGLFRRDISATEQWSIDNANLCSTRQKRILADVWPVLKTGGHLIYSTCTFNPAENEENLRWIAENNQIESIRIPLHEDWGIDEIQENGLFAYRFLPHLTKGEGFFLTILRKKEQCHEFNLSKGKDPKYERLPNRYNEIKNMISTPSSLFLIEKELIFSFPENWINCYSILNKHLKVISSGLSIGRIKNNKLIPEHALALSCDLNSESFLNIELEYEDAIRFLRKDDITIKAKEKDWFLVHYQQYRLGFLKGLGNRMNNYYPREWRIKMNVKELPPLWHEQFS